MSKNICWICWVTGPRSPDPTSMRSTERTGVISAAVPPEELYTEGPMSHEFPRTVSRLSEMQSAEFLALERRTVDTGLT